ncbi:MAG: pyruvate dehydrogenase complex E1 component subunit beta [Chlamydiales bacterium]|nr:pyruvate dehydrogenase complex E1 component subunit beta [Chlamydiales bacterium]
MGTQEVEIREALRQAIDEEMAHDSSVVLMGEEVAEYNGAYKVSKGLLDKYGSDRIIDTPISENGFAGLAVGASMAGVRPIVEFMSWNFSFVAFDQIISNAAKMHYMSGGRFKVPVVFRGPNGAAAQVSCQHSHCVEAIYSNFPGLIVLAPSTAYDHKGLLKSAIRDNNPVIFLENELLYGIKEEIPDHDYTVPIGKAKVDVEGSHITLVSHSRMFYLCRQAVKELAQEGISCELIDLRSIKPLDLGTIADSVRKTHHLLCVEEGHLFSGISAEIAFQINEHCFDDLDAPVARLCQKETPMPYAKNLEAATVPSVNSIKEKVKEILQ